MQLNMIHTAIFVGAAAAVALIALAGSDAQAGNSKEIYQRSYYSKKPMRGYEGHAGIDYYCTYKRFRSASASGTAVAKSARSSSGNLSRPVTD